MTAARRRVVEALLLGVAVSGAVTGLSRVGLFAGWETRAVDAFVFLRDRTPAPEIVLVLINDEAFRELGERQPMSRRYLADLADFLLESGARVVVLDVVLGARTDPAEDDALLAAAHRWTRDGPARLVFATLAVAHPVPGPPRYRATAPFAADLPGLRGFSNAPQGPDGVIRRMVPLLPAAEGYLPALSLAALAAYGGHTADTLARALAGGADAALALPVRAAAGGVDRVESLPLARLAGAAWRIDFAGPAGTVASFPSLPLVRLARAGVVPAPDNPFRDKLVLVGATFRESRETYPTPVGPMSGVEIHANMVHTLLARRALHPPHWLLSLGLLTATCLALALLSLRLRPAWLALASIALIAAVTLVSIEAYARGYWLDFVAPLAGMLAYLQGSRIVARRRLRAAFGQYVSPEVVDRVEREGADLGGELRTVSVLLSDLRGFTTLAERTPPARISAMMNEYLTAMVDVIVARRGLVQDFIGDGILAVYGAPLDDPEHARHAVTSALELQSALGRLNARWATIGGERLAMGVAVHSGEVFAGNVGSPRRKKYTVLGDAVNLAARLEGLNRELGTSILVSGTTFAAVKDLVDVRDRGSVTVRGRSQPVEVFEVTGFLPPTPAGDQPCV